jgi:hypothetical protein
MNPMSRTFEKLSTMSVRLSFGHRNGAVEADVWSTIWRLMRRTFLTVVVVWLGSANFACMAFAELPRCATGDGLLDPHEVFVVLESNDGWGGHAVRSGLSCDGRFRIFGAYNDTTTIRGTVSPDTALAFINGLLALNFFEMPTEFGSSGLQLESRDGGKLACLRSEVSDGERATIELHVGEQSHVVTLAFPASGAPESLHRWARRFQEMMKASRGW